MVNFLISFFFTALISCNAASENPAEALLQEARLRPTTHPITLAAEIRGADKSLPLTFQIEKGQLKYQLHDPEEVIVLKLGSSTSSLSSIKQGEKHFLNDEQRYQEIRNTGVTYDDLSLSFLYWPQPHLAGKETLRGTTASIIELTPPAHQVSPYGSARIWIDQNSGSPLRMEGWNQQGQLIKRFEVISAQKIDGLWMLKEMRIECFDPTTHSVTQRRYLGISNHLKK